MYKKLMMQCHWNQERSVDNTIVLLSLCKSMIIHVYYLSKNHFVFVFSSCWTKSDRVQSFGVQQRVPPSCWSAERISTTGHESTGHHNPRNRQYVSIELKFIHVH